MSLAEIWGENRPRYNGTALYYQCWFSSMITLRTTCCNFYLWWLQKDPPRDVYENGIAGHDAELHKPLLDELIHFEWGLQNFCGVTSALRSAHRPRSPNKNFWVLIQYKNDVLPCVENPILEIRQSYDCLIFTAGIPILVKWHLYTESAPRAFSGRRIWACFVDIKLVRINSDSVGQDQIQIGLASNILLVIRISFTNHSNCSSTNVMSESSENL